MLVPGFTVGAQSIADMQRYQEQIRQDAETARGELELTQQGILELEADIKELDEVLNYATEQLLAIEQNLIDTELELAETEEALEQAIQNREEHFERFKTRLRVMYIHGPVGYLEVVLQATSFSDFLTRLDHMNTIARSDREMADHLRDAEDLVEHKLQETSRQVNRIVALRVVEAERVADYERALAQKVAFMNQLEDDSYQYQALIRQLEQTDRDIEAQIRRAQAEEAARRRAAQEAARRANQQVVQPRGGRMLWPVPGHYRVSSGYGHRNNPITRRAEFHSGLDIPAPSGTEIRAAESGTVIISGWRGGFGNTVVIDHGNGLSTLYGHNSRNLVSEGDWVNRGDPIARIGSTGLSTGPHLHFEVRHDGRHVNPNGYLGL